MCDKKPFSPYGMSMTLV